MRVSTLNSEIQQEMAHADRVQGLGDPWEGALGHDNLTSTPCDSHSCGWLTGTMHGSIPANRPEEDVQLHRPCDDGGWRPIWNADEQATLEDQWTRCESLEPPSRL